MICCTKHIAFLGQDLPFLVCGQLISINQIGNVILMILNNQKHYKDCEHKLVNPPLLFLLIHIGASETDNLFVQKHDQDQNRHQVVINNMMIGDKQDKDPRSSTPEDKN